MLRIAKGTDGGNIIETGTYSYRLARTQAKAAAAQNIAAG